MNQNIPETIQSLIEAKAAELAECKRTVAESEAQEQIEREQFELELIESLRTQVDESLREYPAHIHPDFSGTWDDRTVLVFDIPGLAPVLARFDGYDHDDETRKARQWKFIRYWIPDVKRYFDRWGDNEDRAYWQYAERDAFHSTDFADVLYFAHVQAQKYEQYAQEARQCNLARAERLVKETATDESAQAKARQQIAAMIESDPVAHQLFRLYLMIQDERDDFRAQLKNAQDWLASTERSHQRRLNDAQSALDDAQRDADYERSRADDLNYDLEEAQRNCRR